MLTLYFLLGMKIMSQSQILLRAGEMAWRSTLSSTRTGTASVIKCMTTLKFRWNYMRVSKNISLHVNSREDKHHIQLSLTRVNLPKKRHISLHS